MNNNNGDDKLEMVSLVVPHVTDAIQEWIESVAQNQLMKKKAQLMFVSELGGNIGHIESMPFIEALGQFSYRVDSNPNPSISSAIERIAKKLHGLGIIEPLTSSSKIHVLFPHDLPKWRVGHTFELSWSTPLKPVPVPGTGIAALSKSEVRRQKKLWAEESRRRKELVSTLVDLSLSDSEIRHLTTLGFATKKKGDTRQQ
ncbi:CRM-domain containing factor CFM2, chloroplastic [Glycine soja]